MSHLQRKLRAVLITALALCLLLCAFALNAQAQTPTPSPTPTPTPTPSSATCAAFPTCPNVAPQVIQLKTLDTKEAPIARQRFYLSSCPFNLAKMPNLGRAPSRRSYYTSVKASPQLIKWLETNNCDTVYCRDLTPSEVTCKTTDANCVPEFTEAYAAALGKLNGNADLARRWVTNYGKLSSAELRVGFHDAKMKWLDAAVAAIEKASNLPPGTIRPAVTDRQGIAYFYDLCPGTYYVSNIAPTEIEGGPFVWETGAIKVEKADKSGRTPVTLATAQKKGKKNYFGGTKVAETVSSARAQ